MKASRCHIRAMLLCTSLAFNTAGAWAGSWEERLAESLVRETGAKWVIEEHLMISFPGTDLPNRQLRFRAECPSRDRISRDNFIKYAMMLQARILFELEADAPSRSDLPVAGPPESAFDYEELDEPIGEPDLEVHLRFSGSGVQVEVRRSGATEASRSTHTWKEIFE